MCSHCTCGRARGLHWPHHPATLLQPHAKHSGCASRNPLHCVHCLAAAAPAASAGAARCAAETAKHPLRLHAVEPWLECNPMVDQPAHGHWCCCAWLSWPHATAVLLTCGPMTAVLHASWTSMQGRTSAHFCTLAAQHKSGAWYCRTGLSLHARGWGACRVCCHCPAALQ